MKVPTLAVALLLACAAPLATSEDEQDHSAHHPAQNASPEAAEPSGHQHGAARPNPVLENMKRIEAMMQQIQQTTDPVQKRELLTQHLAALGEEIRLIRSQQGEMKMGMKDGSKDDGGMMGGGMMMHKKVEQRLNILERMLEQMIAREATEASMEQR